jgi:glycosyltransferase involved in cell wall biosynthesis
MKNIYIVCSSLNIGGAEMQSIWLANNLSAEGYKVNYVVLKNSGMLKKFISKDVNLIEYKLYTNNKNKKLIKLRKIYNFLFGAYTLRKNIVKENALVLSFLFHSNIFGFLATIITQSKHVICIRNDRFSSRNSTSNIWIRNFLISLTSLFSYKIVFNSKKSLNKLERTLGNKSNHIVIPNAVVNFHDKADEKILKQISLFLSDAKDKFVSVGRLEPIKNYKNILEAMKRLNTSNIDFKFVIFGMGFLEPELKAYIKDNDLEDKVLMVGAINNAINYLHLFDYFLLASVHEGFPNSLIESMSQGLIPFVTDSGDSFDIVANNRGVKIKDYDSNSIEHSINSYLNHKQNTSVNDMKISIKNYIENDLNQTNIIKQWLTLIN